MGQDKTLGFLAKRLFKYILQHPRFWTKNAPYIIEQIKKEIHNKIETDDKKQMNAINALEKRIIFLEESIKSFEIRRNKMKADYRIKATPININGELTSWTDTRIRIKTELVLTDEDGKQIKFKGILCEEG